MKSFRKNTCRLALCLLFFLHILPVRSEELLLETVVQGFSSDAVVSAVFEEETYFVDIEQLAQVLLFKAVGNGGVKGYFRDKEYNIDPRRLTPRQYLNHRGRHYFSTDFYASFFGIRMDIDPFEMLMSISADTTLPVTTLLLADRRRQNFQPRPEADSFKNYDFDNRLFSFPVLDVSYQKNFSMHDYNGARERSWTGDFYQIDMGLLAGGLDVAATVFGDSADHHRPRARISAGRTLLEEPGNALNLRQFELGDVSGFSGTLFNTSGSGRGAFVSSFKDLVLSADKTIDMTGPLSDGWDVELYLNNQLIGFRKRGINGRYEFKNIPVSYGLNDFKVVFYGPYGEIRTEEKRYYSGTSPVRKGQFGYTMNAYQRNRRLIEENEPPALDSGKAVWDFTGYYGLGDYLTLIGGWTQTPDARDTKTQHFASAGLQLIFAGASFQYNTLYNADDKKTGHHFETQGNIYIGDIFARYDYFGDIQSPLSYYNNTYLKESMEGRLTGNIPGLNLPYFVSYREYSDRDDFKSQEINARLSPNFMRYYNFSVENMWYKDPLIKTDDVQLMLQAQYGDLGLHAKARYRIDPDSYLHSFGAQVDYRWTKNQYVQANWEHDCRSRYSPLSDADSFSLSVGRIFPIGGFTLELSADTDRNAAVSLRYHISLGKKPGKADAFSNAENTMSQRAALYVQATDEASRPLPQVKMTVSGRPDAVVTNDDGEALIADIEPYEKVILTVDTESLDDITLTPAFESKKMVLRPGTVRPVPIAFTRKGGFEAQLTGSRRLYQYQVALTTADGETIATKTPHADGTFIFDAVPFGAYDLVVTDARGRLAKRERIVIDAPFFSLSRPIRLSRAGPS